MNTAFIRIRAKEVQVGDCIGRFEVSEIVTSSPVLGHPQITAVTFRNEDTPTMWGTHSPVVVGRALKPCPFCGGHTKVQSQDRQGTTMHQAYCVACWANLGWHNTEVETIDRWNRRK